MTAATRALVVACLVLLSSAILSPAARSFLGDGSLELSWSGLETLKDGTSAILQKPKAAALTGEPLTLSLVGPGAERNLSIDISAAKSEAGEGEGSAVLPDLSPGLFELQLRHPDSSVLAAWTLLVRPEGTTAAHLDLARSRMTVDPISAHAFGNEEIWSPEELSVLPGVGEEMLAGLDTRGDARTMRLDGAEVRSRTRPEPTPFRIDRALVGVQSPLGLRSAAFRSANRWLVTHPTPVSRVSLHGTGGTSSRFSGAAAAGYRASSASLGPVDVQAQLQWLQHDDAGDFGAGSDELDHNDLESIETNGFVQAHAFGHPLRLELYARGSSRNHYLQEFALNLPHAAQEDRAHLHLTGAYDARLLSLPLSLQLGYQRDYVEVGDGTDFDIFANYSRNPALPPYTPDGLYWAGDNAASSADEGRQFDYYYRSLLTMFSVRAESRVAWSGSGATTEAASGSRGDAGGSRASEGRASEAEPGNSGTTGSGASALKPLRIGVELDFPRWRLYEHLAPSQAAVDPESPSGYQNTRNFGYSQDGDEQASRDPHGSRDPSEIALFATQRLQGRALDVEAGLRWQRFSAGQAPLADLGNPLGDDDRLDLAAEEAVTALAPRIGLYSRLGAGTHVWIDGGRTLQNPPYETLYYDDALLALQAGLVSQPERFGREFIFGNPSLAPESCWSGHLGLAREFDPGLLVRLSGHTARTTDTWIARAVPVGQDGTTESGIVYYDNGGERRENGLHASARWRTTPHSELRVLYDLSRVETNVIEPGPLYRGVLTRDDPVQNIASVQTALPSSIWIEDGVDRGFFPSQFDQTHRFAASWITTYSPARFGLASSTPAGRLAFVLRAASGRPYTATYVRKEGAMSEATRPAEVVSLGDINGERMPETWQIDVGAEQPFLLFQYSARFRVEVRNLTNNENATRVYGATGEPDDDGWLESPEGQAEAASGGSAYVAAYRDRIDDPRHFDDGIAVRAALTVDF